MVTVQEHLQPSLESSWWVLREQYAPGICRASASKNYTEGSRRTRRADGEMTSPLQVRTSELS